MGRLFLHLEGAGHGYRHSRSQLLLTWRSRARGSGRDSGAGGAGVRPGRGEARALGGGWRREEGRAGPPAAPAHTAQALTESVWRVPDPRRTSQTRVSRDSQIEHIDRGQGSN